VFAVRKRLIFTRDALCAKRINYGFGYRISVHPSVCPFVCLSQLIDSSRGEIGTRHFHHKIPLC